MRCADLLKRDAGALEDLCAQVEACGGLLEEEDTTEIACGLPIGHVGAGIRRNHSQEPGFRISSRSSQLFGHDGLADNG